MDYDDVKTSDSNATTAIYDVSFIYLFFTRNGALLIPLFDKVQYSKPQFNQNSIQMLRKKYWFTEAYGEPM